MQIDTKLTSHIKAGKRVPEEANIPYNWVDVSIKDITISQNKTAFFFGGNTTNRPETANGYAKVMKSLMKASNLEKTDVYSFVYTSEPLNSEGYLSMEYETETHTLFENVFKPMLYDTNGGYMKEKKGIEQAFGKIVFATHCAGSNFVNIIIDELYNALLEKFPPSTAELLINKIQYYSYAPHELPNHNVNALFVLPYVDPNFSWSKALQVAEDEKVDTDYPKGVIKRLFRAKDQGIFQERFAETFTETRAIMFKIGNSTYFIPNQINPNRQIGDHSIGCISKLQYLNSATDFEINAKLANYASKLYINDFLNSSAIDTKNLFKKVAEAVEKHPPEVYKSSKTKPDIPID